MARTINEIANVMKVDFVRKAALRTLYALTDYNDNADDAELVTYYNSKFSAVSVETCLIYIVAACAAVVENMMDWFTEDVSNMIDNERYGHAGWYVKKALQFRYGQDINANYLADPDDNAVDGDFAEEDLYPELADESELEALQVVKYAYCEEGTSGVSLKIAGMANNALAPIGTGELAAFTSYINRIKPAGISITVINESADILTLTLTVYYNPLILNSSGELISDTSEQPVETAIHNYLNSIDFNGEFVSMKLVDAIQAAAGVEIVELVNATYQHGNYTAENINTRYTPESGYFTLNDNDCNIEYIANN